MNMKKVLDGVIRTSAGDLGQNLPFYDHFVSFYTKSLFDVPDLNLKEKLMVLKLKSNLTCVSLIVLPQIKKSPSKPSKSSF